MIQQGVTTPQKDIDEMFYYNQNEKNVIPAITHSLKCFPIPIKLEYASQESIKKLSEFLTQLLFTALQKLTLEMGFCGQNTFKKTLLLMHRTCAVQNLLGHSLSRWDVWSRNDRTSEMQEFPIA